MKVNKTVNRNGSIISIKGLNNPQILQDYTSALKTAVFKCGYQDIIVEIYNSRGFFPNVVVPLCGINDYFQSQGVQFTVVENSLNLSNHVLSSHDPSVEPSELNKPLSKIWRFHNNYF